MEAKEKPSEYKDKKEQIQMNWLKEKKKFPGCPCKCYILTDFENICFLPHQFEFLCEV